MQEYVDIESRVDVELLHIARNKVSSHLPIPSCGGRGVPISVLHVAWLVEELIHRNGVMDTIMFPTEDRVEESKAGGVCRVIKSNMQARSVTNFRATSVCIQITVLRRRLKAEGRA